MTVYGQFCPVAQAAEIIAERWTPLVLRELIMGSHRFNEIHRGVPLMSPTLLSKRLTTLEDAGVIEKRSAETGNASEYHLTPAGEELEPVIISMGAWGTRWVRREVKRDELDASVLMWDVQRQVNPEYFDGKRTVVHFEFRGVQHGKHLWWLVIEQDQVDMCLKPPGFDVDLTIVAEIRSMVAVWRGDKTIRQALAAEEVRFDGPESWIKDFAEWGSLSPLAAVERPTHDELTG